MSKPPRVANLDLPEALATLRRQTATARALLDELDRFAPLGASAADAARFMTLGMQFAEALAGLGTRIVECASAMNHDFARAASETRQAL